MNILGTQYTLPTKAFEIYIAGCLGINGQHCNNCHNPETWCFNQGDLYNNTYFNNKIQPKVLEFDNLIKNIHIFGGEPLDRPMHELLELLTDLSTLNKPVWLFTRYSIDTIENEVKELCQYIKCGKYDECLKCENNIQYGITLATSNQHIYKKGVDY